MSSRKTNWFMVGNSITHRVYMVKLIEYISIIILHITSCSCLIRKYFK